MRFLFVIRCRFRPAPEISHYLFRNQFATIETSRNLRRVNFRRLLGLLLETEEKN